MYHFVLVIAQSSAYCCVVILVTLGVSTQNSYHPKEI
jgi:hypothetical protein